MITQGIYEHYKSTPEEPKFYQVLFLSHHEETLKVLVHYVPLYTKANDDITTDGIAIWTRSLKDFTQTVKYNGKTIPRFKLINSTIKGWVKRLFLSLKPVSGSIKC